MHAWQAICCVYALFYAYGERMRPIPLTTSFSLNKYGRQTTTERCTTERYEFMHICAINGSSSRIYWIASPRAGASFFCYSYSANMNIPYINVKESLLSLSVVATCHHWHWVRVYFVPVVLLLAFVQIFVNIRFCTLSMRGHI